MSWAISPARGVIGWDVISGNAGNWTVKSAVDGS
jgi:hypothetical protein